MDRLKSSLAKHFGGLEGYEVEDYVHAYGDPKQALLLARVFQPEFIEVGGYVVLRNLVQAEGGPSQLLAQLNGGASDQKVLAGYRWVEIAYLFQHRDFLSESEDRLLAELIAESWSGVLCKQFPNKEFVVRVIEPKHTGSVVGVGFSEENCA